MEVEENQQQKVLEEKKPDDIIQETPKKNIESAQEIQKSSEKKKKSSYKKRNPFEKTVDDSLVYLAKISNKETIPKESFEHLFNLVKKEILKKEEFYHLVQIYENLKALTTSSNETEIQNKDMCQNYIEKFNEIKNELLQKKRKSDDNKIENSNNDKEKNNSENPTTDKKVENNLERIENKNPDVINDKDIPEELIKNSNIPLEEKMGIVEFKKTDQIKETEKKKKKKKALSMINNNKPANNIENTENNNDGLNSAEKKIDKNNIKNPEKKNNDKPEKQANLISNYFLPKKKQDDIKVKDLQQEINNQSQNNEFSLNLNNINNNLIEKNNNNINENINNNSSVNIQNNRDNLLIEQGIISYDINKISQNESNEYKDFYLLNKHQIIPQNLNEYLAKMKSYFTINKAKQKEEHVKFDPLKNQKFIYIHNSGYQYRQNPGKYSSKISPKAPFIKDDHLIDYEKDSDEEFQEDNGIDIKSVENSGAEEEESESISSMNNNTAGKKWIVNDGHLSEDELSNPDAYEDNEYFEKNKDKMTGIMDILEIRKNFGKPIVLEFNKDKNIWKTDPKHKNLIDKLTISIFQKENIDGNINNNINAENNNDNNEPDNVNINISFPLKIKRNNKDKKNSGIKDVIKNRLDELIKCIHGSYLTKEQMIIDLNNKYSEIPKKTLDNFFKDKCVKVKNPNNGKYYYLVKKEILDELNLPQEEINKFVENNFKEFEEKERIKREEKEIMMKENPLNNIINEENDKKENQDIEMKLNMEENNDIDGKEGQDEKINKKNKKRKKKANPQNNSNNGNDNNNIHVKPTKSISKKIKTLKVNIEKNNEKKNIHPKKTNKNKYKNKEKKQELNNKNDSKKHQTTNEAVDASKNKNTNLDSFIRMGAGNNKSITEENKNNKDNSNKEKKQVTHNSLNNNKNENSKENNIVNSKEKAKENLIFNSNKKEKIKESTLLNSNSKNNNSSCKNIFNVISDNK